MPDKIVRPPSSQHVKSARSLPWRIMLLHINPSILIESARSLRVEKLQIQCNRAYLGTCGEKVLTRRGEERIPRMQEVLIEEWEKISVEEINKLPIILARLMEVITFMFNLFSCPDLTSLLVLFK